MAPQNFNAYSDLKLSSSKHSTGIGQIATFNSVNLIVRTRDTK